MTYDECHRIERGLGKAAVIAPIVCERLAKLRSTHAEIVESDGGECGLMADVRWACDQIEALRHANHILKEERSRLLAELRSLAQRAREAANA
jgi:hypothetical protein